MKEKKGKNPKNKRQEAKLLYEQQEMVQKSILPILSSEYLLKDFQKTQFYSSMDYSG